MNLYDVPRNTYIRVIDNDVRIPVGSIEVNKDDIIFFDHIDGMYSYCQNLGGEIVHLAAWTEVEKITKRKLKELGIA